MSDDIGDIATQSAVTQTIYPNNPMTPTRVTNIIYNFSLQCYPWTTHYSHENKGNDQQPKKHFIVKKILPRERHFFVLSWALDKEKILNPHLFFLLLFLIFLILNLFGWHLKTCIQTSVENMHTDTDIVELAE